MAIKKFAVGIYKDDDELFPAVRHIRKSGYKLHDVYTPFPIDGLDEELGLKETDLHIAGFIFGIIGTATALGFMSWIFTVDWSIEFGGKPFFALPAFIPITFELTVLFAAVGMVLTYCYLNQLMPGVKKHIFHERQLDDVFVIVLEVTGDSTDEEMMNFLSETGAYETNIQIAEEGWWYGYWDKEEDYQNQTTL
ncbi:MAG TPA: DUF3341 domain-containing protein [Fermentimonas sp.]|nr:DUF3341 domain-containing protein [Fermentimonas sp.]